jgi:nicotinamidase-related amidase
MSSALIALHFQNDICHRDGRIPFSLDREGAEPERFLEASRNLIESARNKNWTIVHVHIAFAGDYADLPRNCRLFNAVEQLGALKRGSWGATPMKGFEPHDGDVTLVHTRNNAFQGTSLDDVLRERGVDTVVVIGLATQFSVEHTVRHATDLGYFVTVVKDCCTSGNAAAHTASLELMSYLASITDSRIIEL